MTKQIRRVDYPGASARIEQRTGIKVQPRTLERWDDLTRTGLLINRRLWFTESAVDQAVDRRIRSAEQKRAGVTEETTATA
jgi:hypothetical protein